MPRKRLRKGFAAWVVVAIGFLALPIGLTTYLILARHPAHSDLETYLVHYDTVQPTVVVRGDVESSETDDIVCRVRSWSGASTPATTVKWIIDNGTRVKRGQLLVELDDSGLRERLKEKSVLLEQARADLVYSSENQKIVDSQNRIDLEAARGAAQLADLDLQKYVRGEYHQAEQDLQGRLSLAESDLEMWRDRVAWTERMVKKGFLSPGQSRAEEAHLESARLDLDKLREELRVLEHYSKTRTVKDLGSKLVVARDEVQRTMVQSHAKSAQAAADQLSKLRIFQNRLRQVHDLEHDIAQCTILAPHDGLVVYAISSQARSGFASSLIAQGEPVREGQRLMYLPNLAKMQVEVGVHEALVAQVHAGQRATVHVDAFPDRVWKAHVRRVAAFASIENWSQDLRVFRTQVVIDEPTEDLKPDMSAEVTISTGQPLEHVLTVPVEALVHSPLHGHHCTSFAMTPDGPEERDVVVSMHTDELAVVQSGLAEGEDIVLHPQAMISERNRAAAGDDANLRMNGVSH
jgi:multidrug efflux pump subunit AcrA (membrane-fusion protein)